MRLRWLSITVAFATPVAAQQTKAVEQMAQSVGVIGLFFFAVLSYLAIAGWVALITALAADWVQRKLQVIRQRHLTAFFIGIVVTLALVIAATLLGQLGKTVQPAGLLAALCLLALLTLWLVGWVAVTHVIGERLLAVGANPSVATAELNPLVTAMIGALALHLTAFLPIVGWAVVLYFAFVAVGLWFLR
ncbi:MAG: hypothetical protein PVTTEEND_000160 [Candidatus Fervidibacter sp.]|jgi:hypothetical protein